MTLILAATLLFISSFLYSLRAGKARVDLLSPPVVLAACVLLGYWGPYSAFSDGLDLFSLRYGVDLVDPDGSTAIAFSLALFGASAFFVAYRRALNRRVLSDGAESRWLARSAPQWSRARMGGTVFVYSVVGSLLFSYGVFRVGGAAIVALALGDRIRLTEGLNYLFYAINLLPSCALAWWALTLTSGSKRSGGLAAFCFLSLAAATTQGSKSILFVFVVGAVIMYHRAERAFSAWAISAGAALLFVLLTFYAMYTREYLAVGEFVTLTQLSLENIWAVITTEFLGNFIQLQTLTILVDRVPAVLPFQYGMTLLTLLALPVPRGLWPAKPITAAGIFTIAFWPDVWLSQGTSLPPGLFGEFYLNLGVVGVIFGCAAFGWVAGRVTAQHNAAPRDPVRLLAYSLFVAFIPHFVRGEFVSPTALYLVFFLPALSAILFVTHGLARAQVTEGPR